MYWFTETNQVHIEGKISFFSQMQPKQKRIYLLRHALIDSLRPLGHDVYAIFNVKSEDRNTPSCFLVVVSSCFEIHKCKFMSCEKHYTAVTSPMSGLK